MHLQPRGEAVVLLQPRGQAAVLLQPRGEAAALEARAVLQALAAAPLLMPWACAIALGAGCVHMMDFLEA